MASGGHGNPQGESGMDWITHSGKLKELFGKYKYVLLILGLGILLMLIPERTQEAPVETPAAVQPAPSSKTQELEAILSQISGVGKVKVLLTEAAGAETVYQTNEDRSSSADSESVRVETVIITDSGREETGLVRTVTPPIYLGAIIVCQGGDSASVKLSVVEAVSNVTGISTDRITVLKMK